MYNKILNKLIVSKLENNVVEKYDLKTTENILNFKFTKNYEKLLNKYKVSIVFDKGAVYKPEVKSPVDDKQGLQNLDVLFGLNGKLNLIDENNNYKNIIPSDYIVIGESFGGNLICINKKNSKIYFFHHEALIKSRELFKIANNIDDFILRLTPEENNINYKHKNKDTLGIVSENLSSFDSFVANNEKLMKELRKLK